MTYPPPSTSAKSWARPVQPVSRSEASCSTTRSRGRLVQRHGKADVAAPHCPGQLESLGASHSSSGRLRFPSPQNGGVGGGGYSKSIKSSTFASRFETASPWVTIVQSAMQFTSHVPHIDAHWEFEHMPSADALVAHLAMIAARALLSTLVTFASTAASVLHVAESVANVSGPFKHFCSALSFAATSLPPFFATAF